MKDKREFIEVTTTVQSRKEADALARYLLEKRLAACVQIVSCTSSYHWQGQIEQADEFKLFIKTLAECYQPLEQCILQEHPYETPELVALPVIMGSREYLAWLTNSLTTK